MGWKGHIHLRRHWAQLNIFWELMIQEMRSLQSSGHHAFFSPLVCSIVVSSLKCTNRNFWGLFAWTHQTVTDVAQATLTEQLNCFSYALHGCALRTSFGILWSVKVPLPGVLPNDRSVSWGVLLTAEVGKVTVFSMGRSGLGSGQGVDSAGYTVPFTLFRIRLSSLEDAMARLKRFPWKHIIHWEHGTIWKWLWHMFSILILYTCHLWI